MLSIPSPDYDLALHHADLALEAANALDKWRLVGRAQLYRGHCFRGMKRWEEAHKAYVRGASVADVGSLTAECLLMMDRV